jgi:hypothetical protein
MDIISGKNNSVVVEFCVVWANNYDLNGHRWLLGFESFDMIDVCLMVGSGLGVW